jgi:hypothetical protein
MSLFCSIWLMVLYCVLSCSVSYDHAALSGNYMRSLLIASSILCEYFLGDPVFMH